MDTRTYLFGESEESHEKHENPQLTRCYNTSIAVFKHLDKTEHSPEWAKTNDTSENNDGPLKYKTSTVGYKQGFQEAALVVCLVPSVDKRLCSDSVVGSRDIFLIQIALSLCRLQEVVDPAPGIPTQNGGGPLCINFFAIVENVRSSRQAYARKGQGNQNDGINDSHNEIDVFSWRCKIAHMVDLGSTNGDSDQGREKGPKAEVVRLDRRMLGTNTDGLQDNGYL